MMADEEFLDIFDVKVLEGNAREALKKPYQALLTESTAKKFFGNEDPINKTFLFNDSFPDHSGWVIKDFRRILTLPAKVILSFSENENFLMTSTSHYGSVSGRIYIHYITGKGLSPGRV
jgi:putative ABC transport system permease protein